MKELKTSLKNVFSEKKKKKKCVDFIFFFFPDSKRPNDLQGFNFTNLPKIFKIRKD